MGGPPARHPRRYSNGGNATAGHSQAHRYPQTQTQPYPPYPSSQPHAYATQPAGKRVGQLGGWVVRVVGWLDYAGRLAGWLGG